MRLQPDLYSCGAIALVNAFRSMGVNVTERDIRKDSGTTEEHGAQPGGLIQAIERSGASAEEIQGSFDETYKRLHAHLKAGYTAVILTEDGDHWEAVVGVLGSRVIVFDGQRSVNNRREAGAFVLTPRQLRSYWSPWTTVTGRYAILITPN